MKFNTVFIAAFLCLVYSPTTIAGRAEDIESLAQCIFPVDTYKESQANFAIVHIKKKLNKETSFPDDHVLQLLTLCKESFSPPSMEEKADHNVRLNFFDGLLEIFDKNSKALNKHLYDILEYVKKATADERDQVLADEINRFKDIELNRLQQRLRSDLDAMVSAYVPTYTKEHILNNLSVNLVWTYKELSSDNTYIFPYPYLRRKESIDLFERSKEWALRYPQVTIWYDSQTVSQDAIANTRKKFDEDYHTIAQKIHLKDVRELAIVKAHENVFAHTSIYFRADLLRLVVSYEMLLKQPIGQFLIYADMGIFPLDHNELLDTMTIMNLNEYGVVLSTKKGSDRFENSFHIMGNHKQALLRALKAAVIDLNIQRVNKILEFGSGRYARPIKPPSSPYDQLVYDSYHGLMMVTYGLLGKSKQRLCQKTIDSMSDDELSNCLWQEMGIRVVPPDRGDSLITDDFLNLKLKINHSWYFPTMQSDKFTKSHFG